MKSLVTRLLGSAAIEMWQNNSLGRYAKGTGQHELNLKFHYLRALIPRFFWFDFDTDVIKYGFHRKRPDGIFHKSGIHLLNFLAIEIKRERDIEGTDSDLNKIREDWFSSPLEYRFGASILLKESNRGFLVRLIAREEPQVEEALSDDTSFKYIGAPQEEMALKSGLRDKVIQIEMGHDSIGNLDTAILKLFGEAAK